MQLQICNSGEIWTSLTVAEAHRIVRKRTVALAKMIRDTRKAEKQEAREYRRSEREYQRELQQADRRNRALWKRIRLKPDLRQRTQIERKPQKHLPTRTGWLAAASKLPRYSGQIIDRAGRTGIFFRVQYYGSATKAGVGRRASLYIWQGAHEAEDGRVLFMSNVGETVEEAVSALEAVELLNRAAQDGAKVLFHAIANVPYQLLKMDQGIERMFEIGKRFAEAQFGDRDLPFALALHPPSDEGDQRNWHLHLLFSTRPLVRAGNHEWDIGKMMRRELDNPDAFEAMRHAYAAVQTEVVREAGLKIRYTALSNAERGLPIAPQQHLGSARTARVRRGEQDEVNERNWEKSLAGEASLIDEKLRHAQEAAAAEKALLDRVEERASPMLVGTKPGPHLSITATPALKPVITRVPEESVAIGIDALPQPVALSVANLQSVARPIPASPKVAAILDTATVPVLLGRAAVRVRQHQLSSVSAGTSGGRDRAIPLLSVTAVTSKSPLPAISAPIHFAASRLTADVGIELELSIGDVTYSAERIAEVPKQALALLDNTIDQDVQHIFNLLERRKAEAAARRDSLRREQMKKERVEADRLRHEDERRREDERQRNLAEDARHLTIHGESADALNVIQRVLEAERERLTSVSAGSATERRGVGPARAGVRLPLNSPSRRQVLVIAAADREALTMQWEQGLRLDEVHHDIGPAREQEVSAAPPRRPSPADRGQGR